MGTILEKLMKKYWKNAKNTGKVDEKILEKCKKNWKSQGNSSVQKSGNHANLLKGNMNLIVTTVNIWLNTMAIHLTFCEDYE